MKRTFYCPVHRCAFATVVRRLLVIHIEQHEKDGDCVEYEQDQRHKLGTNPSCHSCAMTQPPPDREERVP